MKPLVAEVRQMVELLDQEHDDVEALASTVLFLAYQLYESKADHGLIFSQDGLYFTVRGFTTASAAERWGIKQGLKKGEAVLTVVRTGDQV